ncbi:hypothetical protein BJX99DRAFT_256664 [Aspergillus californicus]
MTILTEETQNTHPPVAFAAPIAGCLFGYNTGIISAVLVYLRSDLDGRPTSSSEKQPTTSLCGGGPSLVQLSLGSLPMSMAENPPSGFAVSSLQSAQSFERLDPQSYTFLSFLDQWPRGTWGMSAGLIAIVIAFTYMPADTDTPK